MLISYIAYLLFGPQSLMALMSLEERRDQVRQDVEKMKEQNAKIQKEYFELKMLHGKEP